MATDGGACSAPGVWRAAAAMCARTRPRPAQCSRCCLMCMAAVTTTTSTSMSRAAGRLGFWVGAHATRSAWMCSRALLACRRLQRENRFGNPGSVAALILCIGMAFFVLLLQRLHSLCWPEQNSAGYLCTYCAFFVINRPGTSSLRESQGQRVACIDSVLCVE